MTKTIEEPMPVSLKREAINYRNVDLTGYRRSDDLWDFEATLTDTRAYESTALERGNIPAGEPVHHIHVYITINRDMVVQTARAAMAMVPFRACPGALPAIERMVGACIGPGWRRQIEERMGNALSCTHVREVLLHIATMAYQTIPVWFAQENGDLIAGTDGALPLHLGKCSALAFDGLVVARHYPQFARNSAD